MNRARSAPASGDSALVVRYAFNVDLLSGLGEDQMTEVTNLLSIHADRSQLTRLRAEIDAVLRDEVELYRQVAHQAILKDIDRVSPADRTIEDRMGRSNGTPAAVRSKLCSSGLLDELSDGLQTLLDRVSERRSPPPSHAGCE